MDRVKLINLLTDKLEELFIEETKDVIDSTYYQVIEKNGNFIYNDILLSSTKRFFYDFPYAAEYYEKLCKEKSKNYNKYVLSNNSKFGSFLSYTFYRFYLNVGHDVTGKNSRRTYNINFLRYLIKFLNEESHELFTDFSGLKNFLEDIHLSSNEQINLVYSIIYLNNIRFNSVDTNFIIPDFDKISKHRFILNSNKEIARMIRCNEIKSFLGNTNKKYRKKILELQNFINDNSLDISNIRNNCAIIQSILDKQVRIDEDYNCLKNCLDSLSCDFISNKIVNKLKKNDKPKDEIKVIPKRKVVEEKEFSNKELNIIYRELETYFNFDEMKPLKVLSMDEIIYVISLLKKVHIEEDIINKFILISEKHLRKSNIISFFIDYEDKIRLYLSNKSIKDNYDLIWEIIENCFVCSSDEYIEYKSMINEYLKEILDIIGSDYTYEKELVNKLKVDIKDS